LDFDLERDVKNMEDEVAKAIWEAHPRREGLIWENLNSEIRDWVRVQARAALRRLERAGVLGIEDQRVR
jgi:predicted transcriptional regulator